MNKSVDRHREEATVVLPVRFPESHLKQVGKIAKAEDRTKGSVVREALRQYLDGRNGR